MATSVGLGFDKDAKMSNLKIENQEQAQEIELLKIEKQDLLQRISELEKDVQKMEKELAKRTAGTSGSDVNEKNK